jgi:hypothetical protein
VLTTHFFSPLNLLCQRKSSIPGKNGYSIP